MRNFTWNRFPIKICWSIPCLHPSWKVHTCIVNYMRRKFIPALRWKQVRNGHRCCDLSAERRNMALR